MCGEMLVDRVPIRALECHIVDHCNLRCEHCCSYSPLLKPWFADPRIVERDLRTARAVLAPEFLKIAGGEPLLHPELERLLAIAKESAAAPCVQLTTNGFLFERLTPHAWECLDTLTVSLYPEPALPKPTIRAIARTAAARNVPVNWKVQDRFQCLNRTTPATPTEAREVFDRCWIRRRCNRIRDGRFYCCTRPQYVQKLAADPRLFLEDSVELDAARIREYLDRSEPLRTCHLCGGGDAPFAINRQMNPRTLRAWRTLLNSLTGRGSTARC